MILGLLDCLCHMCGHLDKNLAVIDRLVAVNGLVTPADFSTLQRVYVKLAFPGDYKTFLAKATLFV